MTVQPTETTSHKLKLGFKASVVAQAFGTLACLNPGRMILGVGTGESLNEVAR